MRDIFTQSFFTFFVLCLLLLGFPVATNAEPFETIRSNGNPQNRVDIAVLGDGYTSAELPKYRADVEKFMNGIFAEEPYREYQYFYNVHRIDVISNESGADHPDRNPPIFVDTALDATYRCFDIPQLICIENAKVIEIINKSLPASHFDVIIVLINDFQAGGSGGFAAVSSTGSTVVSVGGLLHEIGHTFALLGDEYIGYDPCNSDGGEPFEVNVTAQTEREKIKWKHWIEPSTPIPTLSSAPAIPGLYKGARYCDDLYRPTSFSKMRFNYAPFEQINTEQHVKRIYNFVSPIDDSSPAENIVNLNGNQSQTFSVTTPQPLTHTLNVNWLVDGQQKGNGTSFTLNGETLASGTHTVSAVIKDLTPFVRNDPQQVLSETRNWTVNAKSAVRRALFDFDGDGKADVSVFRPDNGVWYLLSSQSGFSALQFGISTDRLVPADYDGDGKTDIAVYRNGTWYLNRSSAGFTGFAFGAPDDIPQPADFDGDGKADIAVWRPSNGVWYVYNLVTNRFNAFQFGAEADKPVASDYDGDGKADYAVFRPSNGTWYLMKSTDGFLAKQFGDSNDKPVAADYDGDGKTDVAVYRPANGVWYLNRSRAGFTGIQFGITTDLPVPADYDSDGKEDIAVFRSGVWYLNRSTAGFTGIQFGANTDKPVPNTFIQR